MPLIYERNPTLFLIPVFKQFLLLANSLFIFTSHSLLFLFFINLSFLVSLVVALPNIPILKTKGPGNMRAKDRMSIAGRSSKMIVNTYTLFFNLHTNVSMYKLMTENVFTQMLKIGNSRNDFYFLNYIFLCYFHNFTMRL